MGAQGHHAKTLVRVFVAIFACALVVPAAAISEPPPTIEAAREPQIKWVPEHVSVAAGGSVEIKNPNMAVSHGVRFLSVPATPNCTGVPGTGGGQPQFGTGWSGSCSFTTPGTYTFDCTVHGSAMSGSITVGNVAQAPTVTKLAPKKGSMAGGTTVTITGTNFTGATSVSFGSSAASHFEVTSPTSIVAVSPSHAPGRVDVTVTTPGGPSAISKKDRFKFSKH